MQRGRCIILLDALDEVEKEKRDELHSLVINYFKNQNPNNKICITSRSRGFIPEKDIEVFEIEALEATQIEKYVDNIIKLGKFDKEDRESFLAQSKILVEKGFLNSFLVLSLLINIYKAERELPENKLELYQKCFEYIANKREKEKSQEKFNWNLISILMKDNTFMELANLCLPNNSDVKGEKIKEVLTKIYKAKYVSENETELAVEQFLQFCSDRTELFVPASGEDCYKFFHRSFFEYFYSQYIFTRLQTIEDIYDALCMFDVDSEVFELTLAMYKQKNEIKYQELVEYTFNKINNGSLNKEERLIALNILILSLRVIDDELYKNQFVDFIVRNKIFCIKNIKSIHNQSIIVDVIESKQEYSDKICTQYENNALFESMRSFLNTIPKIVQVIKNDDGNQQEKKDNDSSVHHRFINIINNNFYSLVYFKHTSTGQVMSSLNDMERLWGFYNLTHKEKSSLKNKRNRYWNLSNGSKKIIESALVGNE